MPLRMQDSSVSVAKEPIRPGIPLMSFRRTLVFVLAMAALAPGTAGAADVQVVARDVPLTAVRGSAPRAAPMRFTMIGIHWQGRGEVSFRTATPSGTWSAWRLARPEEDDLPDATSQEGKASSGWNVGNPWWTGSSSSIQYRVSGPVTRLRTFFIASEPGSADATLAAPAAQTMLRPDQPPIVRRPGWGADESIVRAQPSFADSLELLGRAPHGGHEQLFGIAVGGHRARDPALPRALERLERHWLQLPRRQVRADFRRPWRRPDRRTSSALMPRGSTPAAWVSPCSGPTVRAASRPLPATRSSSCLPGVSTRATSTRSRSSTSRPMETTASRRAGKCASARSRVIATPATRAARAPRSTDSSARSRRTCPASGCPSSTTPRSPAPWAGPSA